MQLQKRLNLSRFKKSMQGLIEFATLIEQADPSHREKIIAQAEAQDPDLLYKAMRKVVFFEELTHMEETIVAEVLSKISPKVMAYALKGMPEEFRSFMLKQVGFREKKMFQEEEERMGPTVGQALIVGAQRQILKQARQMEAQNKFNFELTSCPRFGQRKKKAVAATAAKAPAAVESPATAATPHLRLVKK